MVQTVFPVQGPWESEEHGDLRNARPHRQRKLTPHQDRSPASTRWIETLDQGGDAGLLSGRADGLRGSGGDFGHEAVVQQELPTPGHRAGFAVTDDRRHYINAYATTSSASGGCRCARALRACWPSR